MNYEIYTMDAFTQVTGATNGVVPVDVNAVAAKELRVEAGGSSPSLPSAILPGSGDFTDSTIS